MTLESAGARQVAPPSRPRSWPRVEVETCSAGFGWMRQALDERLRARWALDC